VGSCFFCGVFCYVRWGCVIVGLLFGCVSYCYCGFVGFWWFVELVGAFLGGVVGGVVIVVFWVLVVWLFFVVGLVFGFYFCLVLLI